MNNVLSLILESKKKKVEVLKKNRAGLVSLAKNAPKPNSLVRAIKREGKISLIVEIKQASPSRGIIRKDFNHLELASALKEAKVNALSVLTEEEFFLGKINYISDIRPQVSLPILRKDFIIDEVQILESRAAGADAILLIARLLEAEQFSRLFNVAKELGMDVVVEVHNEKELKKIMSFSPQIIGINNRNLHTLKVDLTKTEKLIPFIPKDSVVVSESGVNTLKDVLWLKGLGVDAVLVGSAIMAVADIGQKIKELHIDV